MSPMGVPSAAVYTHADRRMGLLIGSIPPRWQNLRQQGVSYRSSKAASVCASAPAHSQRSCCTTFRKSGHDSHFLVSSELRDATLPASLALLARPAHARRPYLVGYRHSAPCSKRHIDNTRYAWSFARKSRTSQLAHHRQVVVRFRALSRPHLQGCRDWYGTIPDIFANNH